MHPTSGHSPRRVLLAALIVTVVLGGCERKKHEEALEKAWDAVEHAQSLPDAEHLKAYQDFLAKFPPGHEYGNPHAQAAEERIRELKSELARQQAQAERVARQEKLLPIIERFLFEMMLGNVDGRAAYVPQRVRDPAPDAVVVAKLGNGRQLTRERLALASWGIEETKLLQLLKDALGLVLYDEEKGWDADALSTALDLAPIEPDTPLLETTARELYPYFRPVVCERWLLAQATRKIGQDALRERLRAWQRDQGGDPSELDHRDFYSALLEEEEGEFAELAKAGFQDGLELGFWVRRILDGTHEPIRLFLGKIVEAHDDDCWEGADRPPLSRLQFDLDPRQPRAERGDVSGPWHGDRLLPFEGIDQRRVAAWSSDGKQVAVLVARYTVAVFDTANGQELLSLNLSAPYANSLAFSPDGKRLAAGASNAKGEPGIDLFDLETGKRLRRLTWKGWRSGSSVDASFVADGSRLLARTWLGAVVLPLEEGEATVDGGSAAPEATPPGPVAFASSGAIALHPTRPICAVGGSGTVKLVDVATGEELFSFDGPDSAAGIAFSADGGQLAIGSTYDSPGVVLSLDLDKKTARGVAKLPPGAQVGGWVGPKQLLLIRQAAKVWDLERKEAISRIGGSELLAIHPDGGHALFKTDTDDVKLVKLR